MLGGSAVIAVIRFAVSLGGSILLFSLMSKLRFGVKMTTIYYSCFSAVLIAAACAWYVIDWESCVKLAAFVMYLSFSLFSVFMSADPVSLTVYKLALTFYLVAVFLISGIEVSVIFFDRNVWADIVTRIVLISAMALFIDKRIKTTIQAFGNYVEYELDRFSVTIMIIDILFGIGFIMNPNTREQTPYRLFQIFMNFFLTGALQLLVFRLYLHVGREKKYCEENQLMKMSQRLLERQVELLEEAGRDVPEAVCDNIAVNNLLAAYMRKAVKEGIKVSLDVELDREPCLPEIDLLTILANACENAIYGCLEVREQSPDRERFIQLMIKRKRNKLVIYCSHTCRVETGLKNGYPEPQATGGVGVLSIVKTAEKYGGEYDFKNDNGVFVFRLIMKIFQAVEH